MTEDDLVQMIGNAMGQQLGVAFRALAIIVASLHANNLINGRAVAAAIRLDKASNEDQRLALADLIDRCIDAGISDGLKPVE